MFDGNLLEKLMELGIGLSVLKQMPNMMDGMMPQQQTAASIQTPPSLNQNNATTYIAVNGQQAGPLTDDELKVLVTNHVLTADTLVWTPQLTNWTAAKFVPNVNKLLLMSMTGNTTNNQKQF